MPGTLAIDVYDDHCFVFFAGQGISCGGNQEGLQDPRSGLLKECFKVFDQVPEKQRLGVAVV